MRHLWITKQIALAAHEQSLADHGGASGIRDAGGLESALALPLQLAAYGSPSIFELAASVCQGIVRNHPFVDGNKRTGFLFSYVFLGMNGYELDADQSEAAAIIIDLAAGKITEADYALWLSANCQAIEKSK
ncbi:MAG: type II toxin-antitoxin system death-on-curing family toxin [Pseudomonadota bacterium]